MNARTSQCTLNLGIERLTFLVVLATLLANFWSHQAQAGAILDPTDTVPLTVNDILETVTVDPNGQAACSGASVSAEERSCNKTKPADLDANTLRYATRPPASVRVQIPGQPGNLINEPYAIMDQGAKVGQ